MPRDCPVKYEFMFFEIPLEKQMHLVLECEDLVDFYFSLGPDRHAWRPASAVPSIPSSVIRCARRETYPQIPEFIHAALEAGVICLRKITKQ